MMSTANLAFIKVTGADTQFTVAHDMCLKSAPAKSRDLVPQMKMHVGVPNWVIDVYLNILGFGGQASAKVNPGLRLVTAQIYNDAMAKTQEKSGKRLFPMAL
jgi:hypothetical protein